MEDLNNLRLGLFDRLLTIYDYAEPIYRKINKELEKNGIENDNLYYIPCDVMKEMVTTMLMKLNEDELYLLGDFLLATEAATVRNFMDSATLKKYINGKIEQTTELWEEKFGEDEE